MVENGFFLDGGWSGSTYEGKVPLETNAFDVDASCVLRIDMGIYIVIYKPLLKLFLYG